MWSWRALIQSVGAAPGSELHRIVTARIPDLIEYQDFDYARRYADVVARVREAEDRTVSGKSAMSEAVAEFGYKLMAYKDEYEVARLLVDPQAEAAVRAEFGEGARVSYRLHPPMLRALGMRRKLKLGPWFRPAFKLLRAERTGHGQLLAPVCSGTTGHLRATVHYRRDRTCRAAGNRPEARRSLIT